MKDDSQLFEQFRDKLLSIDPVFFAEKYLTLDGKPFRLNGNGYKPFSDIYRYIGIKALEPDSLPTILVKGRQVGGTVMAAALELYFMGCGLFGVNEKAPMRIIHAFPQKEIAEKFSKEKLNPMISGSLRTESNSKNDKNNKSYLQKLLDQSTDTSDSLKFKAFQNGNFIRIDSTGLDGGRLRGGTCDAIFYDECFPYNQCIETINGKQKIGKLYEDFIANKELPLIKTFNETTEQFEYKKIVNAWERGKRSLVQITCSDREIRCTANHKFLTSDGWMPAEQLKTNALLKASINNLYGFMTVDQISNVEKQEIVYDIEVEDNHNFILAPSSASKNVGGPIAHNCQDISGDAIGNTVEMLKQAKHGRTTGGIQVYFGTPKRKGSDFYRMWTVSTQQYYYLGCEKCHEYFPLYTPGSNEWEKIWIREFIVRCTHCGFEQDKLLAAERGKWIGTKEINDPDVRFVGFHINQLYMPNISREAIEAEKPGIHPTNTERKFQNEVLGEFFHGDSSPITTEEIIEKCGERDRGMRARIRPNEEQLVVLGIDYGLRSDLEQLANPERAKQGQSYTTAVVLSVKGPNLFSIDLAIKFPKNDPESKKGLIDTIMRQYSVNLAIGDIGFSNDFSHTLHTIYGDKYLVSRAHNKINDKIKFNPDAYPKEIIFERDYYIGEMFELLKKGQFKFPLKDYDKIAWLIDHCASMELKPSLSRNGGDPEIHYVKGSLPNDGLCALMNAYIAYKFYITGGFKIKNPNLLNQPLTNKNKPLAITGYIKRRM
jgi:Phage terminase large subunit (GpA)